MRSKPQIVPSRAQAPEVEKKVQKREEVIKHSAAIHIRNTISLLQRRAWNILLANAYDELSTREIHTIPFAELCRALNYDSHDHQTLRESLLSLVGCVVTWNFLSKDEEEWGVSTLLAATIIKKGTIQYSFSPMLRDKLYNPRMYARISLSMQNKFSSKYALALYELCVDYFDVKRNYGETPYISIDDFKTLMGIKENEYTEFKRLNIRVVKEPVKEINKVSDIQLSVQYRTAGKKVIALKFGIRKKRGSLPALPKSQPVTDSREQEYVTDPDTQRKNVQLEQFFQNLPDSEQTIIWEKATSMLSQFHKELLARKKNPKIGQALQPIIIEKRNQYLLEHYPVESIFQTEDQ